ncbi:MAG TPA: MurR/RpiR family transcriptional regulator [Gaiellaceae bacterium]
MSIEAQPVVPGTTDQDVITNLRRRYDELTNSQKRIAETIVEDPEFVAFATVDKFSARLGVSPSTIVRFAYRIGLSGYPELQEQVRSQLLKGLRTTAAGESVTSHLGETVFAESLQHDLEILGRTAERLDQVDLQRAVDVLVAADRVRVVGGVTAFSIAYYAAVTLDRVREGIVLLSGNPVPTGPLLDLRQGDALLAFSFPPYAKSTLDAIKAAKGRGATVVAVTDSPISPLRGKVDVLLPAVVSGIGTQNSLVAAMAVANALVNGVSGRVPGALERYSETVRLLADWDVYLLESGGDD